MNSVIDILETLESDNSRLFKEDVLQRHRKNDLLKRVFVAVGDPYTNFFVSKFKSPKTRGRLLDDDATLETFLKMLYDDLSTRRLTGNAARGAVEQFFSGVDDRQSKWCLRILLRNLRVGVSESLVEKTWPGAVAKFSVQLAETLGSRHDPGRGVVITDAVSYPVRVEPKLDGLRCVAIKRSGVVTMFTRSGSVIDTLPTIKAALEGADYDDFVLDGECMGQSWNDTASVVMSKKTTKDDSGMVYNVFDAIPFEDWRTQENDSPLFERLEVVRDIVGVVNSEVVVQVSGETVNDEPELMKCYSASMEKGYEGVMLKDLSSHYVFKRTEAVLKLKPVATAELVIVGHYEGNRGSRREGLWGGFEAKAVNGVVTKVGGGFNDKVRAEIQAAGPDAYVGRIIECEYQPDPLTSDGFTSDGKLRFPVFCRFRDPRDVDAKVREIVHEEAR